MSWVWDSTVGRSAQAATAWELLHENAKIGRYTRGPSDDRVIAHMQSLWPVLPMGDGTSIDLSSDAIELRQPASEAMIARATPQGFAATPISRATFATILRLACGATSDRGPAATPRYLRTSPSAGGLYPIEMFVAVYRVDDVASGLYYVDFRGPSLARIGDEKTAEAAAACFIQTDVAASSAVLVLFAAVFQRTTFKYGNRGYRFACIEAGHIAQNLNLAAVASGCAAHNLGGYRDRELDRLLDLDGLDQSVIYATAVGTALT
ncbi:SagB/ThcOx family dehydrogenase [Sphingomonas sp.]|jgi:SagB-type dehydrogenase family enzyme|uniref:SagB/ThcOx family dehydrogenase n=1 Tax=Sphingomonas sp. TaxID=28214 RepID=UPI002E3220FF|nr:SagB/ThcOx family dehydrogenase [Sphingomonas sp.]HEX4694653.1 SagB/ThcOx family dehydrogenase [Sphingomonas sp.]